jgi:hypothetical protein
MADSTLPPALIVHGPRSEGVHVSTLLRKLHPVKSPLDEDRLAVFGLLGLALEDRMERALQWLAKQDDWPWNSFRPGEVVSDEGVAGSPDFLLVPKPAFAHTHRMQELSCKGTWKSSKGFPFAEEGENAFDPKFAYYVDQCLSYGHILDTEGAVLLVYFVCDRDAHFLPTFYGVEMDWSLQERSETWDMLMAIAAEGV